MALGLVIIKVCTIVIIDYKKVTEVKGLQKARDKNLVILCHRKTKGHSWQSLRRIIFYIHKLIMVGIHEYIIAPPEGAIGVILSILFLYFF